MASERDRMVAGEYYDPSDRALVHERERARELTYRYNRTTPTEADARRELLEDLFASIGDGTVIEPCLHCDYGSNIAIGADCYLNVGCVILDVCPVAIGDGSSLGPGVHLYGATHPLDPDARRAGLETGGPITVGENAWIGGRAVLTAGIEVGTDAVVAAGAVVIEDVPERTLVAGTPARVIRRVE